MRRKAPGCYERGEQEPEASSWLYIRGSEEASSNYFAFPRRSLPPCLPACRAMSLPLAPSLTILMPLAPSQHPIVGGTEQKSTMGKRADVRYNRTKAERKNAWKTLTRFKRISEKKQTRNTCKIRCSNQQLARIIRRQRITGRWRRCLLPQRGKNASAGLERATSEQSSGSARKAGWQIFPGLP